MKTSAPNPLIQEAADILRHSRQTVAFTGAGVSVESGIPTFRGPEGLWSHYDPHVLDLDYFYREPEAAWQVIKEIFYDFFGSAKPNTAHTALGHMEQQGLLQAIITQNIDNLHQEGGSQNVIEYHGTCSNLLCTSCKQRIKADASLLETLPPKHPGCGGILKPDFIFFGESIPQPAGQLSHQLAESCDVMLIIGTTGEVMPACHLPHVAKYAGATLIEINPNHSSFTNTITDIYFQGLATTMMQQLISHLFP